MGDKDKSDLETVKLNSADGHQFIVHRKAAMISGTIKSMLSENVAFRENQVGEINFREIATPILERVCQYWYYKLKYTNVTTEIPEFTIEPDIALELLMAANFLDT
mmetsp:Transcript_37785/g.94980  ORF Transcript_37785/g.94980 Transcript_37785/m.94980 type:complete len:106 (+) Transcript_37785:381-698(+)|eukprot:CAMPEP_0177646390 /NCGR_PEP_ID=MMETSP0447-20121125/9750_1 /TAXON_ID=0 /ORGANISM="Stygamoeba regulata, Strain BSH-02190019" /LENGTH=105 /DNA_ID=CAMNT_0019148923 /DNA_START=345 /DNA_END=662 /DNA_ORIENTATION=-